MKRYQRIPRLLAISGLALVLTVSLAQAQLQQPAAEYRPTVGQEGKDVVWVPTSETLVNKMLDMAKLSAQDYLIDLGSGDGRTVITAAKRGARAAGIEYNPDMVALSQRNAAKEGVGDKARFIHGDIFKMDFSRANVLTLFLLPDINIRLRPRILSMKPGVRVVSNSFDMGDWTPDDRVTVSDDCVRFCTAYFWIVPAKVQGQWRMPGGELVLNQSYQMLSGSAKIGGASTAIGNGKMTGDRIAFTVGDTSYTGRVNGNTIKGTSKSPAGEMEWEATRVH